MEKTWLLQTKTSSSSRTTTTIIDPTMLELFTYDFMQRSILAAALVGALCSTIGVFVVLRGLAFMGAGTAHAAFAGVALGFLIGWPPLLLALLFGLATVWVTGWVEEKGR